MTDSHTLCADEPRFVVTEWSFDGSDEEYKRELRRVEEYIDPSKREYEDEFTCSCGEIFDAREKAFTHLKNSATE